MPRKNRRKSVAAASQRNLGAVACNARKAPAKGRESLGKQHGDPYSCYRPGQFTTIAGNEGKPIGNVYFASEHCDSFYVGCH